MDFLKQIPRTNSRQNYEVSQKVIFGSRLPNYPLLSHCPLPVRPGSDGVAKQIECGLHRIFLLCLLCLGS